MEAELFRRYGPWTVGKLNSYNFKIFCNFSTNVRISILKYVGVFFFLHSIWMCSIQFCRISTTVYNFLRSLGLRFFKSQLVNFGCLLLPVPNLSLFRQTESQRVNAVGVSLFVFCFCCCFGFWFFFLGTIHNISDIFTSGTAEKVIFSHKIHSATRFGLAWK